MAIDPQLEALLRAAITGEDTIGDLASDPLVELGGGAPAPAGVGHTRAAVGGDPLEDPDFLPADAIREPAPARPAGPPSLAPRRLPAPPGPRPDTGGRRAHRSLNTLFSALTGNEDTLGYDERVARERAEDKAAFARQAQQAQIDNSQRPIGERVAAQLNLDPNMTWEEFEAWRQGSGGKLANTMLRAQQGLVKQDDQQAFLAGEGGKGRQFKGEQSELDRGAELEKARVSGQRRRGGGGGAGGGGGERPSDEALDAYDRGLPASNPQVQEVIRWLENRPKARAAHQGVRSRAETARGKDVSRSTKASAAIAGPMVSGYALKSKWLSDPKRMAHVVKHLANPDTEDQITRTFQNDLREFAKRIIRKDAGAALTNTERALYAGRIGEGIRSAIDASEGGSLTGVFMSMMQSMLKRATLTEQDVRDWYMGVERGLRADRYAAESGDGAAARLWMDDVGGLKPYRKEARRRVLDAWKAEGHDESVRGVTYDRSKNRWIVELDETEEGPGGKTRHVRKTFRPAGI